MIKPQLLNFIHIGRMLVCIDVANLEKSVKKINQRVDYKKLIRFFRKGNLIDIIIYTATFGTKPHNDFLAFLQRIGYKIVCKPEKQIDNRKKANFDVEIAVDVMELLPHFDSLILFSGDSDFHYLNIKLKSFGKKIFVFSTRYSISKELIVSSTKYFDTKKFEDVFLK
ncbi:MAG TPA: NYN domain-containing protein [Patescibacteria group bacterium]|nr:NYN domain-containing protein [Patescibacteria group bacterium]